METDSRGFILLISAAVTVVYQLSFFAIAAGLEIDTVTDLAGSSNFVLLAWLSFFLGNQTDNSLGDGNVRQLLLCSLVTVWGIRLGGFLLTRVVKRGKDARFDEMRSKPLSFLGFWIFQMIWAFVCSIPVILANSSNPTSRGGGLEPKAFGTGTDVAGVVFAAGGWLIETLADWQKTRWNAQNIPSGPDGRELDRSRRMPVHTGLWAWSRHPNYFGEIAFWLGIWLLSISAHWTDVDGAGALSKSWIAGFVSPLLTLLLLMGLSGAPLAEARYDAMFGGDNFNPEYWRWKDRTSPLIPMPPALYSVFPRGFARRLLCLDCWQVAPEEQRGVPADRDAGTAAKQPLAASKDI